jgi:hypothetical protein
MLFVVACEGSDDDMQLGENENGCVGTNIECRWRSRYQKTSPKCDGYRIFMTRPAYFFRLILLCIPMVCTLPFATACESSDDGGSDVADGGDNGDGDGGDNGDGDAGTAVTDAGGDAGTADSGTTHLAGDGGLMDAGDGGIDGGLEMGTYAVEEAGQEQVALPGDLQDLSGLSHAGNLLYYVVDDGDCILRTFSVDLDLQTGFIQGITETAAVGLEDREDCEEVVVLPDGTIYVSDEIDPAILQHTPNDGLQTGQSLPISQVTIDEMRGNYGYESLALDPQGGFWAATEGALNSDGPLSTESEGMVLRIQHWNEAGALDGQWPYIAEPIPPGVISFHGAGGLGIVDMEVTDDGHILVLERTLTSLIPNSFEMYIFEIDLEGATDVSSFLSLEASSWTPVSKRLLYQRSVTENFESMALGPILSDGTQSLLLMSEGLLSPPDLWPFILRLE